MTTLHEKQRPALLRLADLLDGARRPQDIVGGNAILLAGELIAAARSAHALEDALPHQGLQHGLQVPRRKVMAERERFGGDRAAIRMHGDVDDRSDGENAFARQ